MKFYQKFFLVFCGVILSFSLVAAKSLWEEDQKINSEYNIAKKSYIQALGVYKEARNNYNAALKIYLNSKKTAQNKEEFLRKAKNLFLKANEALISYIDLVKKKVNDTKFLAEKDKQDFLKILEEHLKTLDSQRTKITNLTTLEATKKLATEIKEEAQKIEIDAQKIAGYILVKRANLFIGKSEELTAKIEEKIEILEIQGKNTTEIKKWLLDFKTNIALTKEKINSAKSKFEAMKVSNVNSLNLYKEGFVLIKEAAQILKEAVVELKKIVVSFKKQKNTKVIKGTGVLEVKGNGKITFRGSGEVTGFADSEGKGTVVITDNKGDIKIDTKGKGQKEELGNNQVRYTGVGGIVIFGTDMEIQIIGAKLDVVASGTGIAYFKGEGTYRIGEDVWVEISERGLNIKITPK